ncbi:HlyU family transcriptional regulator [Vibrio neptunius]|uniref:Transcriptional regulator n=1 Tax=Vibrio neptunius TaxID=170651 RepID=A0ABS3A870_9VIBR|nr:transcriptional regulator [Vibrio neptunius]MBN3517646.1 transcriptional regulator [Vibrio neptunius]MBN3552003.1 transcriptional regulator [Vibrio neptunius]MBN3579991.1 transcriptional regulator [Vibrio neptunius]MCH9873657.1 transcriptional regulator [Vibrio neptunius]
MGLFSRLFGGVEKAKTIVEPVEYKGFLIYQESLPEGGQYRIAGRITKELEGQIKEHRFIRSDVLASQADADEFMLKKAQMFIDQMGDTIFS